MDPRKFIMGTSLPGYSFMRPGDRVVGIISGEPETRQMKVWKNGKPSDELATWPDGAPKYQLVIPLQTNFRNWEGIREPNREVADDGQRNVYVNGKHREAELRRAIRAAGIDWIGPGCIYDETYTGDDYNSSAGIKPKLAKIHITPPAVSNAPDGYDDGQGGPAWQQPGWRPQPDAGQATPHAAVPSHHGSQHSMPDWAQAAPATPVSSPPAHPATTARPMSTLDQLRERQNVPVSSEPPPF